MPSEFVEYGGYRIEDRGRGALCAVFTRNIPVHVERGGGYVLENEVVYNEASLADRLAVAEKNGDAQVSLFAGALADLRNRRSGPSP